MKVTPSVVVLFLLYACNAFVHHRWYLHLLLGPCNASLQALSIYCYNLPLTAYCLFRKPIHGIAELTFQVFTVYYKIKKTFFYQELAALKTGG